MRWSLAILFCALFLSPSARAAEGRIIKVLPQFLDEKGRASLTPSLYDRDAYQALLQRTPQKRSSLRFAVEWETKGAQKDPLRLRVEMIGAATTNAPSRTSMEMAVHQRGWMSHWDYIVMSKEQYRQFGDVTAWRVTLWDGDQMLGEQKSFLWQ